MRTALSRRIPSIPRFLFSPNHSPYVYREKWESCTGTHLGRSMDDKSEHVDLEQKTGAAHISLSQTKYTKLPYI